ncbi:MAG: DUF748 domain-containing protein [Gammaproteobacteria bacterium]|nr:DUF748 domain-containing protein [Gammaproteobacteria bacterium]
MTKALNALKIALLLIVFLFFVLWASARWLTVTSANGYFEKDNMSMSLSIEDLSLNLFAPSLTLKNVVLQLPNGNNLAFERLELELQYLPLFSRQLMVEHFLVDKLDVRYHQSTENEKPTTTPKVSETTDSTAQTEMAWMLLLQNLKINNLKLDVKTAGHEIRTQNTHVHLNNSTVNLAEQIAAAELDTGLSLAINFAESKKGESANNVAIDNIRVKTKINVKNIFTEPSVDVNNFELTVAALKAQLPEISAKVNAVAMSFEQLNLNNITQAAKITLAPDLTFSVEKIFARHKPTQSVIADINKVNLDQLGIDAYLAKDTEVQVRLDNINIQDILLLKYDALLAQQLASEQVKQEKNKESNATEGADQTQSVTVFTMNDFNINQLNLVQQNNNTKLTIDSVEFDKTDAHILLHALPMFLTTNDQNKTSSNTDENNLGDKHNKSNLASEPEQQSADGSRFSYQINKVINKQPINLRVQDNSVAPSLEQSIEIDTFNLANIQPNIFSLEANMHATLNSYSQLLLDVNPNTKANQSPRQKDTMLVDLKLSNYDIVSVSPYVKKAADMTIERGNIDLNAIVNITKEGWQGDVQLVLKSLGVSTVNTDHNVSVEDEKVDMIPLNVLLDKISDSKGNLEIDLPIEGKKGELSGLTTGIIRNVVEIVTSEAAKAYLVQTFVPYSNIVSIAQFAGNKLFEIHIDDLVFPEGEHELPETKLSVFDDFAKLIKEKTDLVITVCPVATWGDLGAKALKKGNNSENAVKLPEQQINELYALAKKREVYFKEQLMAKKVDMGRLVSCATKISKNTEKSGYLSFTTKG